VSGRRRFEELVALFAGPLLDEPELDLMGDLGEGAPETAWPLPAPARALGGSPLGRGRRGAGGPEGTARWIC